MAESTSILNQITALALLGVVFIATLALGWVLCERYGPVFVFEIGWVLWGVRKQHLTAGSSVW